MRKSCEDVEYELQTTLDENGEFSGEYIIPEDAPLGSYRLYFQDRDLEGGRQFTVAQYRKPEFQVTVTPASDELLRGEVVEVTINASYFFGAPASASQARRDLVWRSVLSSRIVLPPMLVCR